MVLRSMCGCILVCVVMREKWWPMKKKKKTKEKKKKKSLAAAGRPTNPAAALKSVLDENSDRAL